MLLSQQDDVCPPSIRITFVDGELIAIVPAFRRIRLTAFSITIAIEDRTHTHIHIDCVIDVVLLHVSTSIEMLGLIEKGPNKFPNVERRTEKRRRAERDKSSDKRL